MSALVKERATAKTRTAAKKRTDNPVSTPADVETADSGTDDSAIRPVVIGKKSGRGDKPVETVTIFELDGVQYGVPKEPSAALVLKYLLDWRDSGYNMALQGVGVTLLGPANMAVLAGSADVDEEDLKGIFANVGVVFFGSETYRSIMESEGN